MLVAEVSSSLLLCQSSVVCFLTSVFWILSLCATGPSGDGRGDKICRAISKVQLHALLRVHRPPIDVVVYHGS